MVTSKPVRYPEPFIDIWTGITLTPSPNGVNCLGNGKHKTPEEELIECCCDNCKAALYCYPVEEKKKER